MPKRNDKHTAAEDYLDSIKSIISTFHHSLLQVAMNNGQILAYWRELPYRGQPSKKPPKPRKRVRSKREIHLAKLNLGVVISIMAILFLAAFYFLPSEARIPFAQICVFGLSILLLISGLAKGIDAWNKYLSADDLDEPQDADKNQEK
jgi:hypothetical protein